MPKLYFVKVDVQTCFDTIEQSKLLEILHTLISEDVYMIRKYGEISLSGGRIRPSKRTCNPAKANCFRRPGEVFLHEKRGNTTPFRRAYL
ncbi:hypothetical protein BDQ17DRAFT_661615 [Cyathus striatus]|nr:hypothetical protein BDQ17DRAFT_661615 [Cyathus striatus]